jgi:glutaredoxin
MEFDMTRPGFYLCLFLFSFLSVSAHAEIYKWIDKSGTIHFSSEPPAQGGGEKVNVQVNSFSSTRKSTAPKAKFKYDPGLITTRGSSVSVLMYSASWCGYCQQARNYFHKQNIPFTEYDVEKSSRGRSDYRKLGGHGVPIILVGDKRMNGFSVAGFENLYRN